MDEIDIDIYSDNLHYYNYDEIKEKFIDGNIDNKLSRKDINVVPQEKLPKNCRY